MSGSCAVFAPGFGGAGPERRGAEGAGGIPIASAVAGAAYGPSPVVDPRRPLKIERRRGIMKIMAKAKAKAQTNGKIEKLSPERLAELFVPAVYKTPEEKRAAIKRATTGLRFKTRITRDMYRPG
jgi:hypothetical protein